MESPSLPPPSWVAPRYLSLDGLFRQNQTAALRERRSRAYESLSQTGLPLPSSEAWKYTDITPLAKLALRPAAGVAAFSAEKLREYFDAELPAERLVFINGHYVASLSQLSSQAGVRVHTLAALFGGGPDTAKDRDALQAHFGTLTSLDEQPFAALNTSCMHDGVAVFVDPGAEQRAPLACIFLAAPELQDAVTTPRVIVVVGANARASVAEYYIGSDSSRYFTNAVTELVVGENATVEHCKVQRESLAAYHVAALSARVAAQATVTSHTFSFGSTLARNEIRAVVAGTGARCVLNGLTVLNAEQHVDNDTLLDHAQPHCDSSELFKGIYAARSSGVFSGTIIVRPDAQKTNAYQRNQSLLLSSDAKIETRPQLKIWADDVKCTHGATVGQLDEEALFYIRSRGVNSTEARNMLIHAFASDVIGQVGDVNLRTMLESWLHRKLVQCGTEAE